MKKILFLQIKASTFGGVWMVNKTLSEDFIKKGYEVSITAIRGKFATNKINKQVVLKSLNENKLWEVPNKKEIKGLLFKGHLIKSIKGITDNLARKKDLKSLKKYIRKMNPDIIIVSHYQLLDGIPNEYLKKTINVHHASFDFLLDNRKNFNALMKYNNQIYFSWLSKKAQEKAEQYGLKNNLCIYNPLRFKSEQKADVVKNKSLIYIGRISSEKRVDLLITMAEEVLKKHLDWKLFIYGDGPDKQKIMKYQSKNIIIEKPTEEVLKKFLKASINMNTSLYEGFCLTIAEAAECGVPTISFDFGDAVHERIDNNINGIIIPENDQKKYIAELDKLMTDNELLIKLAKNCEKANKALSIEVISSEWITLFNLIEKGGSLK